MYYSGTPIKATKIIQSSLIGNTILGPPLKLITLLISYCKYTCIYIFNIQLLNSVFWLQEHPPSHRQTSKRSNGAWFFKTPEKTSILEIKYLRFVLLILVLFGIQNEYCLLYNRQRKPRITGVLSGPHIFYFSLNSLLSGSNKSTKQKHFLSLLHLSLDSLISSFLKLWDPQQWCQRHAQGRCITEE